MNLDHIVHFVAVTPEQMVLEARDNGFHAVVGGRHSQWGTANALHFSSSSYIEWLSLEYRDIAQQADHPLTKLLLHDEQFGPGFGTICLRTEAIEKLNKQLNHQGVETTGVLNASRKTPDGQELKWKMLFVKEPISEQVPFPFFIEWQQTQQEKYKDLKKQGQLLNNVEQQTVQTLWIESENPEHTAMKWEQLLGIPRQHTALHLDNTIIQFTATTSKKQRLYQIDIKGTGVENTIEMEGARYKFLP